jgi:hypothetical protein
LIYIVTDGIGNFDVLTLEHKLHKHLPLFRLYFKVEIDRKIVKTTVFSVANFTYYTDDFAKYSEVRFCK